MNLSIIFLAGGVGTRMNASLPKQYLLLNEQPVFRYSFDILKEFGEMIVVADPLYYHFFDKDKVVFANPGARRQDSVKNGFLKTTGDYILVHDAARPFILASEIEELLKTASNYDAATLACPLKFTLKQADHEAHVIQTLPREGLWEIQTPQLVKRDVMREGFKKVDREQLTITDDVSLAELLKIPVKLIKGHDKNLKITTNEDLLFASWKLSHV